MSQVGKLLGVSLASLVTGYFIGTTYSSRSDPLRKEHTDDDYSDDEEEEEDGDEEEEEELYEVDSRPLNEIPGECRMALIVRTDLQMTKGKAAAQCAHAAVALYKLMLKGKVSQNLELLHRWDSIGQAKITLKCKSEEDMDMLFARAISLNINCYIVHDAGRTEVPSGSATVLGLGPAPKAILDEVTRELSLY